MESAGNGAMGLSIAEELFLRRGGMMIGGQKIEDQVMKTGRMVLRTNESDTVSEYEGCLFYLDELILLGLF